MPGIDSKYLSQIDFDRAVRRIRADLRSDLILAPHYNVIFARASDELCNLAQEQLRSGAYSPGLPITMPVPKNLQFSRPGSILLPLDRLVYQALADEFAPILEQNLDRSRTFSQVLNSTEDDGQMFFPQSESWTNFKDRIAQLVGLGGYFVRADVANYFERLPQHHLVNLMRASNCPSELLGLLENMLSAFQERDSFGIIQGVFPSDLLGNYFLSEFDAYCEIQGVESARYVDDLYLRFDDKLLADQGMFELASRLRRDGLHLNERKSTVLSAQALHRDETELDRRFEEARQDIESEEKDFLMVYGFPDWGMDEDEEFDEDEIEARAVVRLYESIGEFPKKSDEIERFCLPSLKRAESDIAVQRCMDSLAARPHMTRTYLSYLSSFAARDPAIAERMLAMIGNKDFICDSQHLFMIAGVMGCRVASKNSVNVALRLLQDGSRAQETRAMAAIFAAKYGTPQQRREVRLRYENEPSNYVRSAILYSARYFTSTEKHTCIRAWGGHSVENTLIAHALKQE